MPTSGLAACAICCAVWAFISMFAGDHYIFVKDEIEEILNLQPRGGKAKPYHVKQVRKIILRYRLGDETHA